MHKTETLEIRHQISTDGAGFIVREMFGGQPAIEWRVPTLELAKRLADERRETLKEMVASISKEARAAVEDARHIDNLKAGKA